MKPTIMIICIGVVLAVISTPAATINYSYDRQHRLVSADYSDAQSEAQVTYQYDAAGNLDLYMVLTDGSYQKSFLLWFSELEGEPYWMLYSRA